MQRDRETTQPHLATIWNIGDRDTAIHHVNLLLLLYNIHCTSSGRALSSFVTLIAIYTPLDFEKDQGYPSEMILFKVSSTYRCTVAAFGSGINWMDWKGIASYWVYLMMNGLGVWSWWLSFSGRRGRKEKETMYLVHKWSKILGWAFCTR